jgi:hypothetical protein
VTPLMEELILAARALVATPAMSSLRLSMNVILFQPTQEENLIAAGIVGA